MTSLLTSCHIQHVCWHCIGVYFIVTCHRQRSTKLSTTYANVLRMRFGFRLIADILSILRELGSRTYYGITSSKLEITITRKPSYRWQTRATRKHAKNCSTSTCLQHCRWQYWSIFIRVAVVASEICEIPRNSLKIQTYGVQGRPRSSILVSIESPCMTSY